MIENYFEKENIDKYTNIIRCWRSIEEITPPLIEFNSPPPAVENIIKEVLGNKEIPWLRTYPPENSNKYIYFYKIFLGTIPIDTMLHKIKQLFSIKQERYIENFNADKRTCLASFILNSKGIYTLGQIDIPDYLISIAARIKYGHKYDIKENYVEIRNRVNQQVKDIIDNLLLGSKQPITVENLSQITQDIFQFIGWNHAELEKIHINNATIYQYKIKISEKKPEKEDYGDDFKNFFNSYFLNDLKKVEIDLQKNRYHSTICKYLSLSNSNKQDVRASDYYQSTMIPQNIPCARWPSKDNLPLVLTQTMAVRESLATKDIFSVNGPPGTGKTTLLKDIIANIIFQKALSISQLQTPEEFFTDDSFSFSNNSYNYKGWLVNKDLLKFFTVVASSNNEAVENITKELPFSTDESWNIDYFKKEAQDIFKSILQNSSCSRREWEEAKNKLQSKILEYQDIITELTEVDNILNKDLIIRSEIDQLQSKLNNNQTELNNILSEIGILVADISRFFINIELQKSLIDLELKNKPTIFKILLGFFTRKFPLDDWQNNFNILKIRYC